MSRTPRAINLSGVVRSQKSGDAIFLAQIRAGRAAAITDREGRFHMSVSVASRERRLRLMIVAPDHLPRRGRVDVSPSQVKLGSAIVLEDKDTALHPFPEFFSGRGAIGYVASWFGPRLFHHWCGMTRRERTLATAVTLFLVPPALTAALLAGVRVPVTSVDERALEAWQRVPWLPQTDAEVRYDEIRPRYYAGVRYAVDSGVAPAQGVRVDAGAQVRVEKGAEILFPPAAVMHVEGRLVAVGGELPSETITFKPATEGQPWGNITLLGSGTDQSELNHVVISGGGGAKALGSDTGAFELNSNGEPVGGGLLMFDTTARLNDVFIEDCRARYGGGIFIRNSQRPTGATEPGGSRFTNVIVRRCTAEHGTLAGGGGIFIKNAFPEFTSCRFEDNQSVGSDSCGGGVFVGGGARALFRDCQVVGNTAQGEGGGVYVYRARQTDEAHASGAMFHGGGIQRNTSHGAGGGIAICDSPVLVDNNVRIDGNEVYPRTYKDGRRAQGAGVFIEASSAKSPASLTLANSRIENNRVMFDATAPDDRFSGGGLFVRPSPVEPRVILQCNIFSANQASAGRHVSMPGRTTWSWDKLSRIDCPPSDDLASVLIAPAIASSDEPSPQPQQTAASSPARPPAPELESARPAQPSTEHHATPSAERPDR